jgi:hypothetical protein
MHIARRKLRTGRILLIIFVTTAVGLMIVAAGLIVLVNSDTRVGRLLSDIFTSLTQTAKLPANFPADVPLYPGYLLKVAHNNRRSSNPDDFTVVYTSTDTLSDIESFYDLRLPACGFSVQHRVQPAGKSEIVSRKSDRIVVIIVQESYGHRMVSMAQLHIGAVIP